jgi:hypothetical protein
MVYVLCICVCVCVGGGGVDGMLGLEMQVGSPSPSLAAPSITALSDHCSSTSVCKEGRRGGGEMEQGVCVCRQAGVERCDDGKLWTEVCQRAEGSPPLTAPRTCPDHCSSICGGDPGGGGGSMRTNAWCRCTHVCPVIIGSGSHTPKVTALQYWLPFCHQICRAHSGERRQQKEHKTKDNNSIRQQKEHQTERKTAPITLHLPSSSPGRVRR